MIDIKLIRSNPDLVKANIKKREMDLDSVVDEILDLDAKRRELTGSTEGRAERLHQEDPRHEESRGGRGSRDGGDEGPF